MGWTQKRRRRDQSSDAAAVDVDVADGRMAAVGRVMDMVEIAGSWKVEIRSRGRLHHRLLHHRLLLRPNVLHLEEVGHSCPFVGRCFSRTWLRACQIEESCC